MNEWILTRDRLPEDERRVLCCTQTQSGRKNLVLGYYCQHLEMWATGMNRNVIAWMDLPDPPEV